MMDMIAPPASVLIFRIKQHQKVDDKMISHTAVGQRVRSDGWIRGKYGTVANGANSTILNLDGLGLTLKVRSAKERCQLAG